MGVLERIGPGAPPPAVMAILSRFDRDQLHGFIAVALELVDTLDGDPDLEDSDEDGQCSEDEISTNLHAQWGEGAGCGIGDPGEQDDHGGCEHDGTEPEEGTYAVYGVDQSKGPILSGCHVLD